MGGALRRPFPFRARTNQEATKLINELSVRWSAAIWHSGNRKRVLISGLELAEKVLMLLNFSDLKSSLDDLRAWLDVKNVSHFKMRQLRPLHDNGLIDFEESIGSIHLLPTGATKVEREILTRL